MEAELVGGMGRKANWLMPPDRPHVAKTKKIHSHSTGEPNGQGQREKEMDGKGYYCYCCYC